MTEYAVTVRITPEDFRYLCEDAGELANIRPDKRVRFQDHATGQYGLMHREWRHVYWLGRDYVTALLARSFLEAAGEDYQVVSDEAGPFPDESYGWVILTDYASPVWARQDIAP